jgi:hypothetical protein
MADLKHLIQDLINGKTEQAEVTAHEYIVGKVKSLIEAKKPIEEPEGEINVGDKVIICYTKSKHHGEKGVVSKVDDTGEEITVKLASGATTTVGCDDVDLLEGLTEAKVKIAPDAMCTVDLDTVDSGDFRAALKKQADKYGVKPRVLTMDGPGGGNPLVRWSGEYAKIVKLIKGWYGGYSELKDMIKVKKLKEDLEEDLDDLYEAKAMPAIDGRDVRELCQKIATALATEDWTPTTTSVYKIMFKHWTGKETPSFSKADEKVRSKLKALGYDSEEDDGDNTAFRKLMRKLGLKIADYRSAVEAI